jgi:hypothetical protein
MPMDLKVNDVVTLKKKHPCGSRDFLITRVGMDFRIRCLGCGHEAWIPRQKLEKSIKKVTRPVDE